jgi:hypothetical protein
MKISLMMLKKEVLALVSLFKVHSVLRIRGFASAGSINHGPKISRKIVDIFCPCFLKNTG